MEFKPDWDFILKAAFVLLLFFITIFLFFDPPYINNGMDWAVAFGTILLAFFAYYAVIKTQQGLGKDRRLQFLKSQIDELYSKVLGQKDRLEIGIPVGDAFLAEVEEKEYLGSKRLISEFKIYRVKLLALGTDEIAELQSIMEERERWIQETVNRKRKECPEVDELWQQGNILLSVAESDYEKIKKEILELVTL